MPNEAHPVWWLDDLPAIFAGYPAQRRENCLTYVSIIAAQLEADGNWTAVALGKRAYQATRYWTRSGKWDLILIALHLAGRTQGWPETSARWGAEAFNSLGYPNTGFFSIVSLAQSSKYRTEGGPVASEPFPIRKACLRADNWRSTAGRQTLTAKLYP